MVIDRNDNFPLFKQISQQTLNTSPDIRKTILEFDLYLLFQIRRDSPIDGALKRVLSGGEKTHLENCLFNRSLLSLNDKWRQVVKKTLGLTRPIRDLFFRVELMISS